LIEPHLREVTLTVNGLERTAAVEPRTSLADFLRDGLRLTGTHVGCEHGVCGACTVLLDGEAVRACLLFAVQAAGCQIETVEGLTANPQQLTPLQEQFVQHHGVQCGFCTPGILMTLAAELRRNPHPSEDDVRSVLSGHLCRCTGYLGMIDAVLAYVAANPSKTD
jgi:carbon-monoxide dehydrogenase small subunit